MRIAAREETASAREDTAAVASAAEDEDEVALRGSKSASGTEPDRLERLEVEVEEDAVGLDVVLGARGRFLEESAMVTAGVRSRCERQFSPQALQSVRGPSGPDRHSGVSRVWHMWQHSVERSSGFGPRLRFEAVGSGEAEVGGEAGGVTLATGGDIETAG